jgi:hypothetical protein
LHFSLAPAQQSKSTSSAQNHNKQINKNKNQSDLKPTTTSEAKESHTQSNMDELGML